MLNLHYDCKFKSLYSYVAILVLHILVLHINIYFIIYILYFIYSSFYMFIYL